MEKLLILCVAVCTGCGCVAEKTIELISQKPKALTKTNRNFRWTVHYTPKAEKTPTAKTNAARVVSSKRTAVSVSEAVED